MARCRPIGNQAGTCGMKGGLFNPFFMGDSVPVTHEFVTESKVRVANKNLSFPNATVTVGTGGTHATLNAAYTACPDGGTISMLSDIDTRLETGGAVGNAIFNNVNKGVRVNGNGFMITQSSAFSFCLRLRACKPCEFNNVVFSQNNVNPNVYIDGDEATRTFVFNNCTFRNTNNSNVNGYFVQITSLTLADVAEKHFEFNNCDFLKAFTTPNTNANFIRSGPASTTTQYLFNGCTMDFTNSNTLRFVDDTKPKIAVYDCTIIQRSSDPILYFGADTGVPTVTGMDIDLRGNEIDFDTGFGQHGILFGRGTDKVYAANNILRAGTNVSALVIGFVIKTRATNLADAIFEGNYIDHPRPILVKGASKLQLFGNSAIGNTASSYGLEVDNAREADAVDLLCRDSECTGNNFIGVGGMLRLAPKPVGVTEKVKTSMLTWTLNNNNYYAPNDLYSSDADNSMSVQWDDKASYWALDANSVKLAQSQLPIILNP